MDIKSFRELVLKEFGVLMVNDEKLSRVIYGTSTSRGLEGGLGEGATAPEILAKYDVLHGYMTKDGYKVKHGIFHDRKTKQPVKPTALTLLIKVNGEYVEQKEDEPEPLEIKVAKRQYKKKSKRVED